MRKRLALVVAISALAATATPVDAGTYDVWSCSGPSGEPLPANGWTASSMRGAVASSCGQRGGTLSGSLNGEELPPDTFARWTFEAPTNTTISSVTIQRTVAASALYTYWGRSYFLFRDSPVIWEGYGLDACVAISGTCGHPGDPANPFAEVSRFTAPSIRAGRLIASAQCDGPNPCPARGPESIGRFTIYRAQIGIADAFPPVFRAAPSGGLIDTTGSVSGKRAVSFEGSDLGGGLRAAEFLVDGAPIAGSLIAAGGSCREPYTHPVPCPLTASGAIEVDTTALQNGLRRVQVALVDAGNNRTLSDPVMVNVHNDKEPNGAGASRVAKLTAKFRARGRRRTERIVRFGKRAMIAGRLVNGEGSPIHGAKLQVHARLDRLGERERVVATVKTGRRGRYSWRTTRGPSRLIRVGYRAYNSDATEAASAEVKLGVRPKLGLRVTPRQVKNRGRIRFRGRLVGGPGKRGTQVTIEAVGRSVRNTVPVTTMRTDRRGRFRFSYRFLRSFAPFTYRFRARMMRQASYPYAGGASRIVTVRIVR